MADNIRTPTVDDDEPHLDLRPLLRLAAWGGCAFLALTVVVFASRSDTGERRAGTAFASLTGAPSEQSLRVTGNEILVRAEADRETRRMTEALRTLSADRDRLANRVAMLERSMEDLTGSIRRQAEAPRQTAPTAPAPATPAPATAQAASPPVAPPAGLPVIIPSMAATPPMVEAPAMSTARKDEAPVQAAAPKEPAPAPPAPAETAALPTQPATAPPAVPPVTVTSVAPPLAPVVHVPRPGQMALIQSYATATSPVVAPPPPPAAQPAANEAGAGSVAGRTEFAIDLGTATSVNGLRALWDKTRMRQPAQLDALRPLVSVRDGQRPGSTELRLVAGPLANASAAARLCATLVAAGIHCQPAVFDGQRLALR